LDFWDQKECTLYASAPEWRKVWPVPGAPPPECLDVIYFGASKIQLAPYWGDRLLPMLPDLKLNSRTIGRQTDAPLPLARATFFQGVLLSEDVRLVPGACCSRD
jgi:hypothetical protein